MTIITAMLGLTAPAQAFCGAYVGTEDAELTNQSSRIVMALSDGLVTLTMFNDYEGDQAEFGLIIPIPAAIDSDSVRLADPYLLERIDRHSAPRLVEYTCEDFFNNAGETIDPMLVSPASSTSGSSFLSSGVASASSGCGFSGYSNSIDTADDYLDTAYGVEIEDRFDLGEYEAWVLQASGGEGLSAWLTSQGFSLTSSAATLFDEYIAADVHFLALRVNLESAPASRDWLSPLQITYPSESWGLPIRMGALSSSGLQDLIVYTITSPEDGKVGISNYPEASLPEEECMLDMEGDASSFGDRYNAMWSDAVAIPADGSTPGFAWSTEYAWGTGQGVKCDPCPDDGAISNAELEALGFAQASYGWHITRLRLRYTPAEVTEDLVMYPTHIDSQEQVRYMVRKWELEGMLPVCGGAPEAPGSCYSAEYWSRLESGELSDEPELLTTDYSPMSCSGRGRAFLLAPLLVGLWRRR